MAQKAVTILHTASGKLNKKNICQNETSMFVPKLPISICNENAEAALFKRLELVQKQGCLFRNFRTCEINYCLLYIFGTVFTKPIGEVLGKLNMTTIGVSNFPGILSTSVFDSYPLEDIVFWLANRERTGVAFSILTYGGWLQMGLPVDKILISNQAEVDRMLNGVYKYLNLLYQHVNRYVTLRMG